MMPGQVGGIASNPANGINNLMLQGGTGATGVAGAGAAPSDIIKVLEKVQAQIPEENISSVVAELQELWGQISTPELKDKIDTLSQLVQQNADPAKRTLDPSTEKLDPTPQEYAVKLIGEVKQMSSNKQSSQVFNSAIRLAAPKKKKKTRGNPFKVLMGKVGKLLDHGLTKKDIVRSISKTKSWNSETIERAVDIVRDYNRKKHHEAQSVNQRVAAKADTTTSIYDIEPDFDKRSTNELFARGAWLKSLDAYTASAPQGTGKKADSKNKVKAHLKSIVKALKDRGFDDSELEGLQ